MNGPETRWQHELRSCSREGMFLLICSLQHSLQMFSLASGSSHEHMLVMVREAKKYGRVVNLRKRIDAFLANPDAAIRRRVRRKKAAKKAFRMRRGGSL